MTNFSGGMRLELLVKRKSLHQKRWPKSFDSQSGDRTLTKNMSPRPPAPSPSGGERPTKVQKPNAKPSSKADQKKQQQQNQKPLTDYVVEGKEVRKPYYEFGYNKNGNNPDPNSSRPKNKSRGKGVKGPKGKGRGDGKGLKGGNAEEPQTRYRNFLLTSL